MKLPTDSRHRVVLEALSQVLAKSEVKTCLLMPNFQNPTGALTPED
jgi:DNA-binding transcriptional MocR family regulator